MNLLLIGGTQFLGRHVAAEALARGHGLTLLTRGKTNPELFPQAERLIADRRESLAALAGRKWDAVIDLCGYLPREVRASAAALQGQVQQYVFISSVSVYAGMDIARDEDSAVGEIEDADTEVVDGRTYGPLKALCERAVTDAFGKAALIVRPGLIVGPHDHTQRFTWWPARVSQGGPVLAPGRPADPVQFIDARDLAAWVVTCVEAGTSGIYNAISPPGHFSMGGVLDACATVADVPANFVWLDESVMDAHDIAAWSHMPIWVPPSGETAGFGLTRVDRALRAGLSIRPIEDTVRDTLAWWRSLPIEQQSFTKAGLRKDIESNVLKSAGVST
jgi:2'-hydroxyisoflavone reductase